MTQDHIDAVIAIENESFMYPWSRSSFEDEVCHRQAINQVATSEDSEGVVAFVCLRRMLTDWHLLKIAVAPGLRRRGIATIMLKECFRQAQDEGMNRIYLELRPSNLPARALYEKLGFKQLGTRRKYYPETGEDALVFVKDLKEAL